MIHVVVSGATRGIGRAIAEKFVRNGAHICACARSETDLQVLHDDLKRINPHAHINCFSANVADKKQVLAFGDFVKKKFNQIDVLVNNAGVFLSGQLHDEPDGQMEYLMQVNFFSAYHLTRALLPQMIAQQSGHIFNICSIASFMAYPKGGAYAATKFALLGFSRSLREELKPYQIKVTAVMPGATLTQSWSSTDLPASRFMPPDDIASIIWHTYSLSPRSVVEDIVIRPMLGDI